MADLGGRPVSKRQEVRVPTLGLAALADERQTLFMRTLATLLATLPLLSLGACATPKLMPRTATFIQAEYDPFAVEGTGSISGEAFLKTRSGDVKLGAGETVILNPVTSYSTEWYERSIGAGEALEPGDERARPYTKRVIVDSRGSFRFDKLPPGDYYLACRIVWEYASQWGLQRTGGMAHARATVCTGEDTRVIVTLTGEEIAAQKKAAELKKFGPGGRHP
jgi:hypothetical protein